MREIAALSGMEVFHAEVWFAGHVQGVGFRAGVMQVARSFDVTGFVRNLPDGRVVLHAEGLSSVVRMFIDEVRKNLGVFIRGEDVREYYGAACHREFRIAI
ncbi:MAG: acylphosphatase [Puniceicoccales bacterium]|nr:acylphosphatase [Puniceicoccales bacterium]